MQAASKLGEGTGTQRVARPVSSQSSRPRACLGCSPWRHGINDSSKCTLMSVVRVPAAAFAGALQAPCRSLLHGA